MEKRNHAMKLQNLTEEHVNILQEVQEAHKEEVEALENRHEENLGKMKADFKAELTLQKTELENKLTELRIEYEQQMTTLGNECAEEIIEEREKQSNNERINGREDTESYSEAAAAAAAAASESDHMHVDDRKYDMMLKELRDRRKSLENDLADLKAKENKVRELKSKTTIVPEPSCCNASQCSHAVKYDKIKAKYSNLVSRIKSEKAKRSMKKMSLITGSQPDTATSDPTSTESNVNLSDGGHHSDDLASSTLSSPKHVQMPDPFMKSASEASDDEELKIATQVLDKSAKLLNYGTTKKFGYSPVNTGIKLRYVKHLPSTPKKAWIEDDLLVQGRRELSKTEKFLKLNQGKNFRGTDDLQAEDVQQEILRQNASFESPRVKVREL